MREEEEFELKNEVKVLREEIQDLRMRLSAIKERNEKDIEPVFLLVPLQVASTCRGFLF